MATSKIAFLTLSVLLAGFSLNAAHAQTPASDESSCRQYVQRFYNWYSRQTGDPSEKALVCKDYSFSPDLAAKLREDRAASAKNPNEVVGLDFDPFVNSQEQAQRFEVGKISQKNGSYLADVYGYWDGKKSSKPDVVPELVLKSGGWQFVNFHYQASNDPTQENLLSVLKALSDGRKKR